MKKIKTIMMVAKAVVLKQFSFAQMSNMSKEKTVMVGGAVMYPSKEIVTIADVNQSNGVIHVIDHVLLPQ